VVALGLSALLVRYVRAAGSSVPGLLGRSVAGAGAFLLVLLIVLTNSSDGRPGSLVVTLFYVGFGVLAQYGIGLGLALLCAQNLPGRTFFRVVFFLPMMITPVGIAYTFRMLSDTTKGPFTPVWQYFGWTETSWLVDPWGARLAVMIGDAWQWIPFMFVVLLVAIESQPQDQREAALVDGASRWQVFRYVTWPAILPVSVTVLLIRAIEAFKIIDLPNVLTNGGPGIASESMTLHAFVAWRALDLGGSAAVAYMLLFVVVFACMSVLAFVRPAESEARA
jgi:multiple sugar transport system permease protein